MCIVRHFSSACHHLLDILSILKNLDNVAIAVIVTAFLFQFGRGINHWAVVCVPFLSTNKDLKLFFEEMQVDSAVQTTGPSSYMCLYLGLNAVKLTASFTPSAWGDLDEIQPLLFHCISFLMWIINFLLLFLVIYSSSTVLVLRYAAKFGRQRAKVIFLVSCFSCSGLISNLVMFMYYKESVDFEPRKDVVKSMLHQFNAEYGSTFYSMILTAFLILHIIRTSFGLMHQSETKYSSEDHLL